jgi:hypothetical protein
MTIKQAAAVLRGIAEPGRLLRVRDAAAMAGLHEETVRRRIRSGEVPAYGFPYRVNLADLLKPYEPKRRQK